MRRISIMLLILCLSVSSLAACSGDEQGAILTSEETSQIEEEELSVEASEDLLSRIEDASQREDLLKQNERVAYLINYIDADGRITSQYNYLDAQRYVTEYEGDVLIDEGGFIYGFDDVSKKVYAALLLYSYEDHPASNTVTGYRAGESEQVISTSNVDGMLVIQTSVPLDEIAAEDMTERGFTLSDDGSDLMICTYVVDPETFMLQSSTFSLRIGGSDSDNDDILVTEATRVEDPAVYVPDEQITSQIFSEDTRTVTVILNPGTTEETIYSITVGKDCSVALLGGPDVFYTDEACTQPYEFGDTEDTPSSLTLYAKSGE